MASTFEKSVKGATKYKVRRTSQAAPPKSKYLSHILIATHSGESGVAEIFRTLQYRLRDSTWTIVFKSLITIHTMIREGSPDVTLAYLSRNRHMLAISSFSDVQTQGRNIRQYTNYLNERLGAFKETKCDYVRGAKGRLEKLTVEKGLLRETESVLDNEPENEITVTVFRMLVWDLLSLFHTMNTGLINILGMEFVARQHETKTKVVVPKLKHAPINLGRQLEDYLRDPEFEANRIQYLKEQEAKISRNTRGKKLSSRNEFQPRPHTSAGFTSNKTSVQAKGPDPDLIDFFESIEQNQQPLMTQSGSKQDTFNANNAAHFQVHENQLFRQNGQQTSQVGQPSFITSNTNGYSFQVPFQPNAVSSIGQNQITSYTTPIPQQYTGLSIPGTTQTTNPFRQSMRLSNLQAPSGLPQTSLSPITPSSARLSTNPFAMSSNTPSHPFSPPPDQNFQQIQQIPQSAPSISPVASGTNPFASSVASIGINSGYMQPAVTGKSQHSGNTNPFRQTTAGLEWQSKQQPIGGGLDNIETIPVFPRPMQQQ
ncbi:hypothetical protein EPUL_001398, partial [Erysiphe pulchra]